MDARDLFRAGRLKDALAAVQQEVRDRPTDTDRRWLLVELLCLDARLDKADAQLEILAMQSPDAAAGVALLRQVVRAEQARRQFETDGRVPEFLGGVPGERLSARLRAAALLRSGDARGAAEAVAAADKDRAPLAGECDGKPFADFRDLDDLTADVFEVLTSTGKFYWVPMERVVSVEFKPPARPRDLLWRRAQMEVRDGPEGEVYVAAVYAATDAAAGEAAMLGRSTDWRGGDGSPVRGIGQRTLLVDDDARPLLEIGTLRFAGAKV
jgi:type VI secretion system protein ImpE